LEGAGMAFFGSYVFHGLLIYPVVRWLTGFRWSAANRITGVVFLTSIGIVFGSFYVFPFWLATTVGSLAAFGSGIYSMRTLMRLVPMDRMPRSIRQLLVWSRIAPSGIS
jgi:antigen flippase